MNPPDVVVAGAGVIGAACARAAARRGLRVVVCDPGPLPGAASPASAGMLAAQIDPEDAMLAIAVRARDFYAQLAPELRDATGIDIGLWRGGILSVAFDEERADELQAEVAHQRQAGLRCDWLSGGDVRQGWPGVAIDCVGGLLAPEDGALDPEALCRALLADAVARGAERRPVRVTTLRHQGGRVTGVTTSGGDLVARHVVVAAGAWAPQISGLPRELAVDAVRGQLASLPWPPGVPHAIVFDRHSYAVARGEEAIAGSTMEHVGFDAAVTPEGLARLRATVGRLLPWLADRPFTRSWAGLRPVAADGRPSVGPDPKLDGLWYAAGHGRQGILLAALTGEIIGDLLATGQTEFDWEAMRPRA